MELQINQVLGTEKIDLSSLIMFSGEKLEIDVPALITKQQINFLKDNYLKIRDILIANFGNLKYVLNFEDFKSVKSVDGLINILSKEFYTISNNNHTKFYWKSNNLEFNNIELEEILDYSNTFEELKKNLKLDVIKMNFKNKKDFIFASEKNII